MLQTLSNLRTLFLTTLKKGLDKITITRMDYKGGAVKIYADSMFEQRTRRHSAQKEPDTIEWIHSWMKKGDVVFDIGANIGAYSLIIAKHLENDVTVFAFEPAWINYTQLNRNILLNKMESCVHPILCSLSDTDGIPWFFYSSLETGSAEHASGSPTQYHASTFEPVLKQRIPTYTLDRMVMLLGLEPNHLKIDVDGLEPNIIRGAQMTLSSKALRTVLCEFTEAATDQEAIQSILGAGFEMQGKVEKAKLHQGKNINIANWLFVRKGSKL